MDQELDSDPAPDPAFLGHVADKMLPVPVNKQVSFSKLLITF
jgi:hypothetical protein